MQFKSKKAKRWASQVEQSQAYFDMVAVLQAENTPDARLLLKKMREVRHDTDPKPTAGELWNPGGKQLARGSTSKHKRIMAGQNARAKQGRGI